MNPDLFRKARAIFDEAVELPESERAAFLRAACEDPEVREEVDALLLDAEGPALTDGVRDAMAGLPRPHEGPGEASSRPAGPYELIREIGQCLADCTPQFAAQFSNRSA